MRRPAVVSLVVLVAVGLTVGGYAVWTLTNRPPTPIDERCSATVGDQTTTITIEQAGNAAIIAGVSVKRGLAPRAASIALTTAYQESGLRNLDYGHSDSLGLFQQRPSKGWGTKEQVMDPWYSSTAFYKALVRVKNWQTRDIGDAAQAVQRSAYPDAYAKHVANARALASSLAGETPASFTCALRTAGPADPDGMQTFLAKTYGNTATLARDGDALKVTTSNAAAAWSVAQAAVATTKQYGVGSVTVGGYSWTYAPWSTPKWLATAPAADTTTVTITFPPPK